MQFKLYESAIFDLLNNKNGPVGRELARRGRKVESAAKKFVGKESGALRTSINSSMQRDFRGIYCRVGSSLPYALDHHNGTRRHVITAKPGGFLRFPSRGRIIFETSVLHPGTRPNPYLLKALPAARL